MKLHTILAISFVGLLAVATLGHAADAAKPDVKGVRLIKPYSDLKDLTADQTTKLKEIHKKYSDEIKDLEAKQKDEMMMVLTDVQKKELGDTSKKAPRGKMKDEPATPVAPTDAKTPAPAK